jgi:hypothetical protein
MNFIGSSCRLTRLCDGCSSVNCWRGSLDASLKKYCVYATRHYGARMTAAMRCHAPICFETGRARWYDVSVRPTKCAASGSIQSCGLVCAMMFRKRAATANECCGNRQNGGIHVSVCFLLCSAHAHDVAARRLLPFRDRSVC